MNIKTINHMTMVLFAIITLLFCKYAAACNSAHTWMTIDLPSISIPESAPQFEPFTDWITASYSTYFISCAPSRDGNAILLDGLGVPLYKYEGATRVYGVFPTGITGVGFIIEGKTGKNGQPEPNTWHAVGLNTDFTSLGGIPPQGSTYKIDVGIRIKLIKTERYSPGGSLHGKRIARFYNSSSGAGVSIKFSGGTVEPLIPIPSCDNLTIGLNRGSSLHLRNPILPGSVLANSLLIGSNTLTCLTHEDMRINIANQSLVSTNKSIDIDGLSQTIYQIPGIPQIGITIAAQWDNRYYVDLTNSTFTLSVPVRIPSIHTRPITFKIHYVSLMPLPPGVYRIPQMTLAQISYASATRPDYVKAGDAILRWDFITIHQPACVLTIDGSESVRSLTLPTVQLSSISSINIGETVPSPLHASFRLAFLCPNRGVDPSFAALTLKYSFVDPTRVGSSSDYLNNMLKTADAAKGVGIRLFQNNKKFNLGTTYTNNQMVVDPASSGLRYIPMRAHYIRLPGALSAGKVQGLVTVHFSNP